MAAAQLLGAEAVPVDFQDYESEAAEWADLIADNRISELAETDTELLAELLRDIDAGDRVPELMDALYRVVNELESMFLGRRFTPDGHLVGSLGGV